MSKFEINRITKELIRAILRFRFSFLAPKLKETIYVSFKDVQMMLKIFFDISTGFRFPKLLCGSVPSIPVLSCP